MAMDSLKDLIMKFKETRDVDSWVEYCKKQKNLSSLITIAAIAENEEKKRHPHQYRRNKETLKKLGEEILKALKKKKITHIDHLKIQFTNFDKLLTFIEKVGNQIYDIGKLTIYDTAHRIAESINIPLEKIYLHSGTKVGAEELSQKELKVDFILPKDLPEELQNLSCVELENFLCIYKNELKKASASTPKKKRC